MKGSICNPLSKHRGFLCKLSVHTCWAGWAMADRVVSALKHGMGFEITNACLKNVFEGKLGEENFCKHIFLSAISACNLNIALRYATFFLCILKWSSSQVLEQWKLFELEKWKVSSQKEKEIVSITTA